MAFDTIRFIVEEAKARATRVGKTVQPVVATNLAVASDEILAYCRDQNVQISTSLDGPAWLRNRNRPRPKSRRRTGYDVQRYLQFYKQGCEYILELNHRGIHFVEIYARILLTKILTRMAARGGRVRHPA